MSAEPRRTLDQRRAVAAYSAVTAIEPIGSKYASRARDLPAMLIQCGIGQTLAFLASKTKDADSPEAVLSDQLCNWLVDSGQVSFDGNPGRSRPAWLLEVLMKADRTVWHAATQEAIAYATWLKRFAEAFVQEDPQAVDNGGGESSAEGPEDNDVETE